ncbi:MAG: hypothetical protein HKN36_06285 [Hellea sp.]|nr:hypothetical protein [Hellea sp.]
MSEIANRFVHQAKQDETPGADEYEKPEFGFVKTRFPVERFDHRKGLRSLQVHQTIASHDGRMWCATPSGLACLDGINIFMFDRKHGLISHGLRTLAIDTDNNLWIGTDVGIEVLDISSLIPRRLWSSEIGTVNTIDILGSYGLIGSSNGLFIWGGDQSITLATESPLAHATIKSIKVNSPDQAWIIGPQIGLQLFNISSQVSKPIRVNHIIGQPTTLCRGPDSHMLVGGINGLVLVDNTGAIDRKFDAEIDVDALLYYEDMLWVGGGKLLSRMRIENDSIDLIDTIQTDISVLHLTADNFENIWISTGDQALLRMGRMRHTLEKGLETDIGSIMCIRQTEGGLLIGGSDGMTTETNFVRLPGMTVWDILKDEFGKYWIATDAGLYCTVNPNFTIPYRHNESPVVSAPNRALTFHKGEIYISSIRGLAKIEYDGVKEILSDKNQSLGYVYSLHDGADGALWIATLGNGVFRLSDGNVKRFDLGETDNHSNAYAFADDGLKNIYIAHGSSITKIDPSGNYAKLIESDAAIAAWTLKYLEGDRLVAGSSNGLVIYDAGDGSIRHRLSGNFDDVPWEFTTSRSLEILDGKTVYCGLGSGLRIVNLDELEETGLKPRAEFAYARWKGTTATNIGQDFVVKAGRWFVEIGLKTCWFLDNCEMRFILSGFDARWSDWSEAGKLTFNSLPAGDYSLDVEVRSPIAGKGPKCRILNLAVE